MTFSSCSHNYGTDRKWMSLEILRVMFLLLSVNNKIAGLAIKFDPREICPRPFHLVVRKDRSLLVRNTLICPVKEMLP